MYITGKISTQSLGLLWDIFTNVLSQRNNWFQFGYPSAPARYIFNIIRCCTFVRSKCVPSVLKFSCRP